jgi:hypothetical protein
VILLLINLDFLLFRLLAKGSTSRGKAMEEVPKTRRCAEAYNLQSKPTSTMRFTASSGKYIRIDYFTQKRTLPATGTS